MARIRNLGGRIHDPEPGASRWNRRPALNFGLIPETASATSIGRDRRDRGATMSSRKKPLKTFGCRHLPLIKFGASRWCRRTITRPRKSDADDRRVPCGRITRSYSDFHQIGALRPLPHGIHERSSRLTRSHCMTTPPTTSIVAGLLGGIGCGKSTVARRLAERGATLLDADALAHEALQSEDLRSALVEHFGVDIVDFIGRHFAPGDREARLRRRSRG